MQCPHKVTLAECMQCWDNVRTRARVQKKFCFDYFDFCNCRRTSKGKPCRMRWSTESGCPHKAARAKRTAHHARNADPEEIERRKERNREQKNRAARKKYQEKKSKK